MVGISGLPGKFKAWTYHHGILPRILWLPLVYEFPLSIVGGFEISCHLRRWLGLPSSLSSTALYGNTNKLKPTINGLSEEFCPSVRCLLICMMWVKVRVWTDFIIFLI